MSSLDLVTLLYNPQLSEQLRRVEKGMKDATASDNLFLHEPVTRILAVRGKRLRPSLVLAVANGQAAGATDLSISGAIAIELVHLASLIHDDIIDDAASRWNIPTINAQEGINRAILVGDYLLAKAAEQAATVNADVARVVASTIATLTEGQGYELADDHNADRSMESLHRAMRGKTASLMAAACQVGAIAANCTPSQITAFAQYGEYFGMAFQLIDDVLDFLSTTELLGKPTGNDVREGVYTMPLLLALQGSHRAAVEPLLQDTSAVSRSALIDILFQDGCITETIKETRKYNQKAQEALKDFDNSTVKGLLELPNAYLRWSLSAHVAGQYQAKAAPGTKLE